MKLNLDCILPIEHIAMPEVVLWLAVIERAMLDAVYPKKDLPLPYRRDLRDFFYNDIARPYNLVYICNTLFDASDAHIQIRRRLEELLNSTTDDQITRGKRYKGYY